MSVFFELREASRKSLFGVEALIGFSLYHIVSEVAMSAATPTVLKLQRLL